MRVCSRYRPTMENTVMRSVRPAMPGSRQQMPRTFITTSTPAWEAWASLSMSFRSVMELSFRKI